MQVKPSIKIFFVVPPKVHLLDVSGPIHVFYEAIAYDANLNLKFLSINNDSEQLSSAGLSLNQLENYNEYELSAHDIIFIPGLDSQLILDDCFEKEIQAFLSWLSMQSINGAKICSVCTGAYLLGFAGLLDKKECTTHWKYLTDFRKRFPQAKLHNDRLFVKDNNIYSSAGVSSGIDLALYLIEELYDPIFATTIAKEIVIYLRRAEEDPQLSIFLQYRNHIENRIHTIQDHLAQHLAKKQKIDDLAERVNMSPRNLTRLFKKTTGITIGEYHNKLKVEQAIQLFADGQKVEAVSQMCGLSSNQLRTLLKKYADLLPSYLS